MAAALVVIFLILVGLFFAGLKAVQFYKTFLYYKVHYNNSRSFINSLPGYVFIFTENLQYYDCNDAVLNVLNMKYEDLINKPLGLVNSNLNFANKLENFNLSGETYQSFVIEDNVDFSEIKKYFFCVLTKAPSSAGDKICAVCIDITELHAKEEQMAKHRHELFELEKLITIGELSSGVAHEINNPLAIISGRIQVMLRKINNKEIQQDYLRESLNKILDSVARISRITQSLRILGKNSIEPQIQSYTTQDVLEPIMALYSHKVFFHCIYLTIENDFKDTLIRTDLADLAQVVLHILNFMIAAIKDELQDNKWMRLEVKKSQGKIQIWFTSSCKPNMRNDDFTGLSLKSAQELILRQNGNLRYSETSSTSGFVIELPQASSSTAPLSA